LFLEKTAEETLLKELYFLLFTEDNSRGAVEEVIFLFLQKTPVEALLKENFFLVFTEDGVEALLKEHSFFVVTEDDGRGAAQR
jgi:hypothetical protein